MRIFLNSKELNLDKLLDDYGKNICIKAGWLVGIKSDENLSILLHYLHCLRVGAVPFFIPPYFTQEMMERLKENIYFNVICLGTGGESIRGVTFPVAATYHWEPGTVVYISTASSGEPKIIVRNKESLKHEVERYCSTLNMCDEDTFLPIVPLYHAFGMVCGFLTCHYLGGTLSLTTQMYPRTILKAIHSSHANIVLGIPAYYQLLIRTLPCGSFSSREVKYFISSGAKLSQQTYDSFYAKFQYPICSQYGTSETGSLALSVLTGCSDMYDVVFPNVHFSLDSHSAIMVSSPDTIGKCMVQHCEMSHKTNDFLTGDCGEIVNGVLHVTGRSNNIINIRGNKISESVVRQIIMQYGGIDSVRFIMKDDNYATITFCITLQKNTNHSRENFLVYCKEQLPSYVFPAQILYESNYITWKEGYSITQG